MSLFYPRDEHSLRGKTSDREDMVKVRFVELAAPRRIGEVVSFVTDPALFGEMTMTLAVRRRARWCATTCRQACGRRTTRPARALVQSSWPAASNWSAGLAIGSERSLAA
jgi:hypothetical protein